MSRFGRHSRINAEVAEAIQLAYEGIGGLAALIEWARGNPATFYTKLWAQLLPVAVTVDSGVDPHALSDAELAAIVAGARGGLAAETAKGPSKLN